MYVRCVFIKIVCVCASMHVCTLCICVCMYVVSVCVIAHMCMQHVIG